MFKIKKGDQVQILAGKDQGKSGTVEKVDPKKGKVAVSGLNMFKRHVRKYGQIEGGIIEILKPLNISNVALVCPKCKKATRVGFDLTNGKKRVCKKCKAVVEA